MNKNITISIEQRLIDDLKLHALYKLLAIAGADVFEATLHKEYNLPGQVLVTDDNYVLSNAHYVDIARLNDHHTIEVHVVKGICEDEIIQIINLKQRRFTKSKTALVLAGGYLTDYLSDRKDTDYFRAVPGDNTRDKVVYLLGTSIGTYESAKSIYGKNPELLKDVDDGNSTLANALAQINSDEVEESNVTRGGRGKPPKNPKEPVDTEPYIDAVKKNLRVDTLSLNINGYGLLTAITEGDDTIVALDDVVVDGAEFTVCAPVAGETFHCLFDIPQIGGIHIVASSFENLKALLPEVNTKKKKNAKKINWFE